ncbi:MAG TPA: hypothetical protein VM536_00080, partial [Chloroflexia bacterium]|nr:hypothetical protein [Chloroflexia bacterium]
APALEITLLPFPFAPFGVHTAETARGAATGFLERGADGIYLFNFMDAPASHPLGVGGLRAILKEIGSLDTMADKPRRHVVTFASPRYPGEPHNAALPYRLGTYGYRPSAEFRVPTGPAPAPGQEVFVRVGLQADVETGGGEGKGESVTAFGRQIAYSSLPVDPVVARELRVYLDGVLCPFAETIPLDGAILGPTHSYRVPPGALHSGENVVELRNRTETTALVVWVEVKVESQAI